MERRCDRYTLKLGNLPLFALRREFNAYHSLIAKPEFRERLGRSYPRPSPVDTPLFVWLGLPSGFLTLILQRAFSGIEAYVSGAAYIEVGKARGLNDSLVDTLMDPFSLGGKGTADNYYNRVPTLASPNYALERSYPSLWEDAKITYREVRNPIFHGYQVDDDYASSVLGVFDFVADLYRWIDEWCNPDTILPGAAARLAPNARGAA